MDTGIGEDGHKCDVVGFDFSTVYNDLDGATIEDRLALARQESAKAVIDVILEYAIRQRTITNSTPDSLRLIGYRMVVFASALAHYTVANNKTLTQLAENVGVKKQQLSRIVRLVRGNLHVVCSKKTTK